MDNDTFITREEVCELLKISPGTYYRILREDRLPGIVQLGRHKRVFHRETLIKSLAARAAATTRA